MYSPGFDFIKRVLTTSSGIVKAVDAIAAPILEMKCVFRLSVKCVESMSWYFISSYIAKFPIVTSIPLEHATRVP